MLTGAAEQFFDFDRSTLEAVNGGHAVRKIHTLQTGKVPYNQPFDGSLKAADIYGLITEHRQLFANVQASTMDMATPACDEVGSSQCGLYGHCGSKIALKHEFSYTVNGEPAYGATEGVGFEDDVLLVSMEGHPIGDGIDGTINALDIRTGDWYPLPQLAVGTVEMAFTISTGNPDWIAVGVQVRTHRLGCHTPMCPHSRLALAPPQPPRPMATLHIPPPRRTTAPIVLAAARAGTCGSAARTRSRRTSWTATALAPTRAACTVWSTRPARPTWPRSWR
jgi:hypothetical protein